ncbi:MAG: 1,4-alpha-glucan branching protein GlgB [Alphaproteobacteria bacterium]|jgi:1,4-alpha-glucan branching enzyme|nr:1,4-alpha-glucan branching protein GlgB [Alphaproteobacteria bacterium]
MAEPGIEALAEARHGDPFALLGPHREGPDVIVRTLQPGAKAVSVVDAEEKVIPLARVHPAGLFAGPANGDGRYRLRVDWPDRQEELADPYAFGLLLGDLDLHLIAEGRHQEMGSCLGAHVMTIDGVAGTRFAVWAPNARRVSVVGDFNGWDGRRHPMRLRREAGVWELFIPAVGPGRRYKYEILGADGQLQPLKADPVGRATEPPPATASIVPDPRPFRWTDEAWMAGRARRQGPDAPIAIYEVHAGSWAPAVDGREWDSHWDMLADRLVAYAAGMGFTHVELLPVTEHPFGGSWGYQPIGLFAPTARFGPPDAFARFVDRCHAAGIGVILDWVPAHFPTDAHGLVNFDGTALYEHRDPREGFHQDWNTLIYNLGRNEVAGFLIASALEWLERYHVDGIRVDAVASMLYRDYSRKAGEWVPNIHGGRENLEAVAFLRRLNETIAARCPGALAIAEESTAWPGVSRPVAEGGLGFSFKWNMGWMHDTLRYVGHQPVHRRWHHDDMTFGLVYAFSERFVLPLSHDEVVHGKGSLLARMPGDDWQRFANLRAYLGFMWSHPGKKLIFMGGEFGQPHEWNHDVPLAWDCLDDPRHRGLQLMLRDLNRLYCDLPALHRRDTDPAGFAWLIGDDRDNSVFAYLRRGGDGDSPILAIVNMTPLPRRGYRVGVPGPGRWREVFNSDAGHYGGSNLGNDGEVRAASIPAHGQPASVDLTLPPLSTILLKHEG